MNNDEKIEIIKDILLSDESSFDMLVMIAECVFESADECDCSGDECVFESDCDCSGDECDCSGESGSDWSDEEESSDHLSVRSL